MLPWCVELDCSCTCTLPKAWVLNYTHFYSLTLYHGEVTRTQIGKPRKDRPNTSKRWSGKTFTLIRSTNQLVTTPFSPYAMVISVSKSNIHPHIVVICICRTQWHRHIACLVVNTCRLWSQFIFVLSSVSQQNYVHMFKMTPASQGHMHSAFSCWNERSSKACKPQFIVSANLV